MNAEQERARLLRERLEDAGIRDAAASVPEVPWKSHGVVVQSVFFVLTCVGLIALYWFLHEIKVAKPGLVSGCIAIVFAEFLIRARRWYGTGVESALWLGGLFALISELPSSGEPESYLVLAAASAVAGFRMRNALFGAYSAFAVVIYFEERFDLGLLSALLIALVAVLALLRTWRRPSTEWLWIALGVTAPVSGYVQADEVWRNVTILFYASFGVMTLALAIRKRHHALFLSAGVALAVAAIETGRLFTIVPLEAKLALGGALLLGGSWILTRALRARTTGIVVTPSQLTVLDDAVEIAGTINLPQPEFDPAREDGGGKFGGAGATGSY